MDNDYTPAKEDKAQLSHEPGESYMYTYNECVGIIFVTIVTVIDNNFCFIKYKTWNESWHRAIL